MEWIVHIRRFVLTGQTHQTCLGACRQIKSYCEKIVGDLDDVTRPPLLIAEAIGAFVNLMVSKHYVLYVLTAWDGFDANQDEMKHLPFTYNGEVTKLTRP